MEGELGKDDEESDDEASHPFSFLISFPFSQKRFIKSSRVVS